MAVEINAFRELSNTMNERSIAENFPVVNVNDLIAVLADPQMASPNQERTVICDLDGVVFGFNRTYEENLAVLLALRTLVRRCGHFTLSTGRIEFDDETLLGKLFADHFDRPMSIFPFISDTSLRRLYHFLSAANPDCDIQISASWKKLIAENPEAVIPVATPANSQVVIIGSSPFDLRLARCVAEQLKLKHLTQRLTYFTTQRSNPLPLI